MYKVRIDFVSGKGHQSMVKEFNNKRHFDNWSRIFEEKYKIIGSQQIKPNNASSL
jgi:hypothetical protein